MADTPQMAMPTPAAPPATESRRLSVRSCRTIRVRGAPSVARSATSPSRSEARTRRRFATFAHAMSRTMPTAPMSTQSAVRTSATCTSSMRSNSVVTSRCDLGNAAESCADAPVMRSCTCASVTPGSMRPTACM